jgi:alanine-glyoxylate transaminase/serine-glyoxylate transaminase/serine-pyruvate transaminase
VPDPKDRSCAVTTIISDNTDFAPLRKWCSDQVGLVLGIGLGFDEHAFRIGHMGHMNPPMLLGALATIDAGLKALDIPHGAGALDAAIRVISR